jgi:thioredoxin-related protein
VIRLVIALVLVGVAIAVALIIEKRRPAPPTQPAWAVPSQLDRDDFDRPDAPWLVVVFTSATCSTCKDVLVKTRPLESSAVAVQEVEAAEHKDLHQRYAIDAVPMLVLADAEGVVRGSLVGPASAEEIWLAVSEVRDGPDGTAAGSGD